MAKSSYGAEKLAQQLAALRHARRVTEAEALMNIDKAIPGGGSLGSSEYGA
ncbi:MAG: hypothetical protein WCK17_10460 [Verrucomicrobiota bacterium]